MSFLRIPLAIHFLAMTALAQLQTPVLPTVGYDSYLKNRYVSIDPSGNGANMGLTYGIRVTLTDSVQFGEAAGMTWWVGEPDENCIAGLVENEELRTWDQCPALHITGCGIVPVSEYAIRLTDGQGASTPPLAAFTVPKPGPKQWGDTTGSYDNVNQTWSRPDGSINIVEAVAAIISWAHSGTVRAAHVTVVDVHPQIPNRQINIDDAFSVVLAFQGAYYHHGCPHDPCWDNLALPCP